MKALCQYSGYCLVDSATEFQAVFNSDLAPLFPALSHARIRHANIVIEDWDGRPVRFRVRKGLLEYGWDSETPKSTTDKEDPIAQALAERIEHLREHRSVSYCDNERGIAGTTGPLAVHDAFSFLCRDDQLKILNALDALWDTLGINWKMMLEMMVVHYRAYGQMRKS